MHRGTTLLRLNLVLSRARRRDNGRTREGLLDNSVQPPPRERLQRPDHPRASQHSGPLSEDSDTPTPLSRRRSIYPKILTFSYPICQHEQGILALIIGCSMRVYGHSRVVVNFPIAIVCSTMKRRA
jgi:hypothetical protein